MLIVLCCLSAGGAAGDAAGGAAGGAAGDVDAATAALPVAIEAAVGLEKEAAFLSSRVASSFDPADVVVVADDGALVVSLSPGSAGTLALRITDDGGVVAERSLDGSPGERMAVAWIAVRAAIERARIAGQSPAPSSGLELLAGLGVEPAPPFSRWAADVGVGAGAWRTVGPAVVRGSTSVSWRPALAAADAVGRAVGDADGIGDDGCCIASHAAALTLRLALLPHVADDGGPPLQRVLPFVEAVVDVAGGAAFSKTMVPLLQVGAGVDLGVHLPLSSALALQLRGGARARLLEPRTVVDDRVVDEGVVGLPVSLSLSWRLP